MSDVVVTVPKTFRHPSAPGKRGLAAWIAEGDAAGEPATGIQWGFFTYGTFPRIQPGERLYVVCEGKLRGYSPLTGLRFYPRHGRIVSQGAVIFIRRGGAVPVTIAGEIIGFRGWRYRWWDRIVEVAFPDWKTP